jgi:DNA adenine methylase
MKPPKRIKALAGWMGGKRKVTPKITQMIASYQPGWPITCYAEAFVGMGWELLSKASHLNEHINDINDNLVTLWDVVKTQKDALIASFKYVTISADVFYKYRERYKANVFESPLERAHVFLYLILVGYGSKAADFSLFISGERASSFNHKTLPDKIEDVWGRLQNVFISCMPYDKFVGFVDGKSTIFFFDPPYYQTGDYGKDVAWGEDEYRHFQGICSNLQGGCVITVNGKPLMYELFQKDGFYITEHGVRYSMVSGADKEYTPELIITNFEPTAYASSFITTRDKAQPVQQSFL